MRGIISGEVFGDALAAAAARYIAERQPNEIELKRLGLGADVIFMKAKLVLRMAGFDGDATDAWLRAAVRGFCHRVQDISVRPQHPTLQ